MRLLIIIVLFLSIIGSSQETACFDIDPDFKFVHYNDHWRTLERTNLDGDLIIDTIYSCNYDSVGRIIVERKNNLVIFYDYLNNGKIAYEIVYPRSQVGIEFGLTYVYKVTYFYFENGLLEKNIKEEYRRKTSNEFNIKRDSMKASHPEYFMGAVASTYDDYSDVWGYEKYETPSPYTYNKENLLIRVQTKDIITNYYYDDKKRLYKMDFCEFGLLDNGLRDSTNCQRTKNADYFYTDSSKTTIEVEEMAWNKFVSTTDTIYNKQNKPKKVLIKMAEDHYEGEINYEVCKMYYYDELGRLSRIVEYYNEEESGVYKYYYKNNGG